MDLQLWNLINLKLADYLIIVSLNGILTALISWWIKIRLEQSIKHQYDKKIVDYNFEIDKKLEDHKLGISQRLEDYKSGINTRLEEHKLVVNKQLEEYKFDIRKREQAAKIVELFSLLQAKVPQDAAAAAKSLSDINRLAWELSLWLPEEIVRGLSDSLKKVNGAKDPKEILVEIRKVLLGGDDKLKAEDIVHFTEDYDVSPHQDDLTE